MPSLPRDPIPELVSVAQGGKQLRSGCTHPAALLLTTRRHLFIGRK